MAGNLSRFPKRSQPWHRVAVHPEKAPRCWVRSVHVREPWGCGTPQEPQIQLKQGRGLGALLARSCPQGGKAEFPLGGSEAGAGCRCHGWPGAYLAFPPWVGLGPVGNGPGGQGRGHALYREHVSDA